MNLGTVLVLFLLAAVALLAALNWGAFMAPATISLAVTSFQAPLGLLMLGIIAVLATLFLAYIVFLQGTVLLEARRHARDLQAQRELADRAEASRFTELRTFIAAEIARLEERASESRLAVLSRLDRMDRDLSAAMARAAHPDAARPDS